MTRHDDGIDWELGSWEGARRAQLRGHRRLTLREKLVALEEMCELSRRLVERSRARRRSLSQ